MGDRFIAAANPACGNEVSAPGVVIVTISYARTKVGALAHLIRKEGRLSTAFLSCLYPGPAQARLRLSIVFPDPTAMDLGSNYVAARRGIHDGGLFHCTNSLAGPRNDVLGGNSHA